MHNLRQTALEAQWVFSPGCMVVRFRDNGVCVASPATHTMDELCRLTAAASIGSLLPAMFSVLSKPELYEVQVGPEQSVLLSKNERFDMLLQQHCLTLGFLHNCLMKLKRHE